MLASLRRLAWWLLGVPPELVGRVGDDHTLGGALQGVLQAHAADVDGRWRGLRGRVHRLEGEIDERLGHLADAVERHRHRPPPPRLDPDADYELLVERETLYAQQATTLYLQARMAGTVVDLALPPYVEVRARVATSHRHLAGDWAQPWVVQALLTGRHLPEGVTVILELRAPYAEPGGAWAELLLRLEDQPTPARPEEGRGWARVLRQDAQLHTLGHDLADVVTRQQQLLEEVEELTARLEDLEIAGRGEP